MSVTANQPPFILCSRVGQMLLKKYEQTAGWNQDFLNRSRGGSMRRLLLCVALVIALPGLWNAGVAKAAAKPGPQVNVPQNLATSTTPGYVGSDTCITCHAEVGKNFAANPHAALGLMHNGKGITCEACHGPGQAHVEGGGDVTKIFRFDQASSRQINARCLSCHAAAHPNFERSPHAKAGVNCVSCHSIHATQTQTALLKLPQPTLCFTCHNDVKGAFDMPFHHPVNEGVVKCSDCHDPHGTFQNTQLRTTADQNMICTKCHTDVRGPFVYEHAPVKGEGCLACHTPHGSQNARLLNMPSINTLCNQCHSAVGGDTIHGQGPGSQEILPCTNCHTMIHGSNLNAAFIK
jgi:DmsE family decaheme c-type cytochrome